MTQWRIRLGAEAERDIADIIDYTLEIFGQAQANLYRSLLFDALSALLDGPDAIGCRNRSDILPGLFSLHVSCRHRKGRHLILFRASEGHLIEVLRVLHDAMELKRHLPD